MLVLTRKVQEQIRIGDEVTVTVLRVKGNKVRIGIEAPGHVRVVRGELPDDQSATSFAGQVSTSKQTVKPSKPAAKSTPGPRQPTEADSVRKPTGLEPMVERVGHRCYAAKPGS